MKKRLLYFIIAFVFIANVVLAQTRTITGTVTDKLDGGAIPGVSVLVKGSSIGVQTSGDGKFSIAVPQGGVLVFKFVGYATKEVTLGSSSVVNVALDQDSKQLGEIVVTALGIPKEKKALGYATGTVKGEELTKARDANVVNGLAGKVSGVRVTSQSGTVGGSSKIVIRGANSFNGDNQPLFVVDGLPIDNGSPKNGAVDYGNRASDINSDDIESMSILKGAAATALYGARAKSGAVIITTKKGSKNSKMAVTVNSSVRFDDVLKLPEFQNEYSQGSLGSYYLKYTNGWGPNISGEADKQHPNFLGQNVTLQAYDNNVKDFFQTGGTYMNSVSFEGGSENSDYRASFGSTNQSGVISGQSLDRYNVGFNGGRSFNEKLNVRSSINYVKTKASGRPVQSSNDPNVLTTTIYGLPRTVDINQLKNNYVDPVTGAQIPLTPEKTGNNPYWIINNNTNKGDLERMYGNAVVAYSPVKWLSISNNLGVDFYTESRKNITKKGTAGALDGQFSTDIIKNRILNNDLLISAQTKLNRDLDLKATLGHSINEREYNIESVTAKSLTIDNLYTFSNAASSTPSTFYSKRRLMGIFGEVGLSYKNYLFLNVTGRNDWSSTLPKANRSYFYPSVSSSFVFTELMQSNPILSFGKIRASWANVGSDEEPYQLNFTYAASSTYYVQYSLSGTFPHGGLLGFTGPRVLPPLNLRPQNQVNTEIGTDLKFFNDRIGLGFTFYNTKTSDQIVSIDVPLSTGFFAQRINVGAVQNRGIELDLNVKPFKSNVLNWDIDMNFAKNKQKVLDLPDNLPVYAVASGWSGLQIKAAEGESFGLYGNGWKRDPEGNFVINSTSGLREIESNKRLGNIYADWTMGINNSFSYKNLTLGFLVDIRKGGVIFSGTASTLRNSGLAEETLENRGRIFVEKGVIQKADGSYVPNTVPVQSMQDFWNQYSSTSNTEGSVFDASYVKLREVRLSYKIPAKILKGTFIGTAEVGVEGRNLWIIKDYVPHVDAESNFFGPNGVGEGVEFNTMPSTRSFGFNVRVKF